MEREWLHRSLHGRPPKHAPLPGHDRRQTVLDTTNREPARYFPDVDAEALERSAVAAGIDVPSGKPATYYRVLEMEAFVGASDGQESRWVLVESTNGEYHGRPITEERFKALVRRV